MTPANIFEKAVLARVRGLNERYHLYLVEQALANPLRMRDDRMRDDLYTGDLPTLATLRSCMRAEIGGRKAEKLIEEMVQRGVLVLSVDERGRIWVSIAGEVSNAPAQ